MKKAIVTLTLLACFPTAWATLPQTGYVIDKLYINIRSGMGSEFRIIATGIPSNTELQILQADVDAGWTKVLYKDKEGWVQSQYLSSRPTAGVRLKSTTAQLQKTQAENKLLNQELNSLKKDYRKLSSTEKKLKSDQQKLSARYDQVKLVAANPIKVDALNKQLNEKMELQNIEISQLNGEVARLRGDQRNQGMTVGALAVFGGFLLGWILTRRNKRGQSGWG